MGHSAFCNIYYGFGQLMEECTVIRNRKQRFFSFLTEWRTRLGHTKHTIQTVQQNLTLE